MKSGFLTSEFLVVVVMAILSVVVAAGYLSPEQSTQISDAVAQVIEAIAKLVGALAPVIGSTVYTWSRTKIKLNSK